MSATPAGTFEDPTPRLRMVVGNNSAVKTGITTLLDDTQNFPTIANTIVSHCRSANTHTV